MSDAPPRSVPLAELLGDEATLAVQGDLLVRVSSLATDSRKVLPGGLFFAVPGVDQDGARYVAAAAAAGAVAVVVEGETVLPPGPPAIVRVADCRSVKARLAARFFGHPSRLLPTVGITGTNGKTTSAFMLRSIAEYAGGPTVLLGTIAYEVAGRVQPSRNTTPDPIEIQQLLREGLDAGARLAVMEVSSHALTQERVTGVEFRAAAFTNLTPEHLDYHSTFAAYRAAKGVLFRDLAADATAVLNADDPAAEWFAARTRARILTYGLARRADVTAQVRRLDIDGVSFILRTPQGAADVTTRLPGRHNLKNAMAAAATALALGTPLEAVRGGLQMLRRIPGRLEPIDCGQDFRVLVDYAHTHDALENVLANLRPLTRGRLITVFGCGGDRDRQKRPLMGEVAARLSDVTVVTSDNPRSEEPGAIIDEVLAGMGEAQAGGGRVSVEPDRRRAIELAIGAARGGDIVLIAGKGHEAEQVLGSERIAFDDGAVAREVLWQWNR